jgi:hypothetical protein
MLFVPASLRKQKGLGWHCCITQQCFTSVPSRSLIVATPVLVQTTFLQLRCIIEVFITRTRHIIGKTKLYTSINVTRTVHTSKFECLLTAVQATSGYVQPACCPRDLYMWVWELTNARKVNTFCYWRTCVYVSTHMYHLREAFSIKTIEITSRIKISQHNYSQIN